MSGTPFDDTSEEGAARLGPVLGFMRALWEVNHGLESTSKQMKRRLGVSGPERLAIRIVGELPDISPGALADILHVDPSSLTALLKRLVRRRLILRHADVADARRSHLRLTDEGRAVDRIRSGTVEAAVRSALDALAPRDVATAVVVLGALARSLGAASAQGARVSAGRAAPPARPRAGPRARRR